MKNRAWIGKSLAVLRHEEAERAETPVHEVVLSESPKVSLFVKDESTHPSGSLKHRLASRLFLDAICNGSIREGATVVEASSGSTAISEAYFSRLLGLGFIAVVTRSTSPAKVQAILEAGGECHYVDEPGQVYDEAELIASRLDGYYMDQFTHAERVMPWSTETCMPAILMRQLAERGVTAPDWFVIGAGTGGTSATMGRYLRYANLSTKLCVVDPVGSVFAEAYETGCRDLVSAGSNVEGIGRPRVEPSFVPEVIDRMMTISNADTISGMHRLSALLGAQVGPSTGTAMAGVLLLADEFIAAGRSASLVTVVCDGGDRYRDTYYNDEWVANNLSVESV